LSDERLRYVVMNILRKTRELRRIARKSPAEAVEQGDFEQAIKITVAFIKSANPAISPQRVLARLHTGSVSDVLGLPQKTATLLRNFGGKLQEGFEQQSIEFKALGLTLDIPKLAQVLKDEARVLLDYRQRISAIRVEEKAGGEIVTEADHKVQNDLTLAILNLFPTHRIIAEEELPPELEKINAANKASPFVWIIDPLDGTGQFRNPESKDYGIAVTLLYQGKPLLSFFMAPEYEYKNQKGILFA